MTTRHDRPIRARRIKERATALALAVSVLSLGLAACNHSAMTTDPRAAAAELAAAHGFQRHDYMAGPFRLLGYEKFARPGADTLTVYIEGDGRAWIDRWTLSDDPTPARPDLLALATEDPSPNRLYLGRPCQYLPPSALAHCSPVYWSSERFAPEVVAGYETAIDKAKRQVGAVHLHLFGFSGGGAVAALVAARRSDVTLLVTVAGTLDTARWTRDAGVSPLTGSLNPADFAARLQKIRQVIFVGGDDNVMPPAVARSYLAHMTDRSRATFVEVPDFTHSCCWVEQWPELLARYVYDTGPEPSRAAR